MARDADAQRAYYRAWKKGEKKKRSNKFYDAAKHANERAERYGVDGRITTADARAVLDGAACAYCGDKALVGLDHKIALAVGGPNERSNLVAACRSCNSTKWRNETLGRWARNHDCCIECKGTAHKHIAGGRCSPCYWRKYERDHPDRPRGGQGESP